MLVIGLIVLLVIIASKMDDRLENSTPFNVIIALTIGGVLVSGEIFPEIPMIDIWQR